MAGLTEEAGGGREVDVSLGGAADGVEGGESPADWRKSIDYHYYEWPQPHHVQPHFGVRTERHKLIYYHQIKEWELFDLKQDPAEMRSVYADPAYAGTVTDLKAELQRLQELYKDTSPEAAVKR